MSGDQRRSGRRTPERDGSCPRTVGDDPVRVVLGATKGTGVAVVTASPTPSATSTDETSATATAETASSAPDATTRTPTGTETGVAGAGPSDDGRGPGGQSLPGFGTGVALAGLLAGGALFALWRRR